MSSRTKGVHKRKNRISYKNYKKNGSKDIDKNKLTIKELILMQCVACSVILLGGLVLNINNPSFVKNFNDSFREIILDDSLVVNTSHFRDIREHVIGVFNNTTEDEHVNQQNNYGDFRIDEDILYEINLRNELRNSIHAEDALKKE